MMTARMLSPLAQPIRLHHPYIPFKTDTINIDSYPDPEGKAVQIPCNGRPDLLKSPEVPLECLQCISIWRTMS